MGAVGAGVGAVTGLLGGAQSFMQAGAIEREAEFTAKQNEFNAKLSRLNAEDAINRGEKLAASVRRQKRQTIGSQRAAFAAQGIAIDAADESTGQLQTDVEMFAALDELEARQNALKESRAFELDAINAEAQAGFARASGKQRAAAARFEGLTGVFTSALSGLAGDVTAGRITSSGVPSFNLGDIGDVGVPLGAGDDPNTFGFDPSNVSSTTPLRRFIRNLPASNPRRSGGSLESRTQRRSRVNRGTFDSTLRRIRLGRGIQV